MIRVPLAVVAESENNQELIQRKFEDPAFVKDLLSRLEQEESEKHADTIVERPGERWLVRAGGGRFFRVVRSNQQLIIYAGELRDYITTPLPTLSSQQASSATPSAGLPESSQKVLLSLYAEAGSQWRTLTDVRFKLLGLVPAVSVFAWVQLITAELVNTVLGALAGILIALAGLRLTRALESYDDRNDGLYNDAISRARKIEDELGVDTGLFRGRRRAADETKNHGAAVKVIYVTVKWGWIAVAVYLAVRQIVNEFSKANDLAL